MNDLPFQPIADPTAPMVLPASPQLQSQLINLKNYAEAIDTDEDLKEQFNNGIIPLLYNLRSRRRALEDEWAAIRRMGWLLHDSGKRYNGRSNAYLPVWAKALNMKVGTLQRGLFPSDEYMNCFDRGTGSPEAATALKAWMRYQFEEVAHVKRRMKPYLKQFVSYGNSVAKVGWQTKEETRTRGRMKGGIPIFAKEPALKPGLTLSTRDILNVYVFPETAERVEELQAIFEDVPVSRVHVNAMAAAKKWVNTDKLPTGTDIDGWKRQMGLSENAGIPDIMFFQSNTIAEMLVLSEVYCYLKLPADAYLPGEDTTQPVPCRAIVSSYGNVCVRLTRNPFFHQQFPYLWARQQVEPGQFYGQGDGRLIRWLQYLSNDFANQMNDVGIYALNPIMLINPGLMASVPPPLRPGVTWQVSEVKDAVRFERPPTDLVQVGQQMVGMWTGMVNDMAGTPPVLQGVSAGGGAKTATGAQILQRNALSPMQDQVEDLEGEFCLPLMHLTWSLGQQFQDESINVVGGPALQTINPSDLAIDAGFQWTASSQAVNQAQRAQLITQFLSSVMPLVQYLNMIGYVFDPAPLIERLYSDGMGLRGFDQVLFKKSIVQGIQPAGAGPMPQSAGAPPGGPPPPGGTPAGPQQGDLIRSALQQIPGGDTGDLVPGEGEDFMDVRKQADELAATFGGIQ